MKRDLTKIFIDEIYSKPPKRNYPTNKIIYNHVDETWSIDLADFSDYKTSKKRKPLKIEFDRGAEFYNSIFQNFFKSKSI